MARKSCSFLILLLSLFNFALFSLSAASFAPMILLKNPPAPIGWAFLTISAASLLSSLTGFYSYLANCCFIGHVFLLLPLSAGQLIGIVALFREEESILAAVRSPRDPREVKVLVRLECGVLMAMFVMQLSVLILSCAVHACWVRDYERMEAEREAAARNSIGEK